jgi:hypothetical protein
MKNLISRLYFAENFWRRVLFALASVLILSSAINAQTTLFEFEANLQEQNKQLQEQIDRLKKLVCLSNARVEV